MKRDILRSKVILLYLIVPLVFLGTGCAKKPLPEEDAYELEDAELLSQKFAVENNMPQTTPQNTIPALQSQAQSPVVAVASPAVSMPDAPLTPQNIQDALKRGGFYRGNIDGKIGSKTKAAIKEFQKSKGLKVDGVVGPVTWAALKQYLLTTAPLKTE